MLWKLSKYIIFNCSQPHTTTYTKQSNARNAKQMYLLLLLFLDCTENVNQSFGQLVITYSNKFDPYCNWIIGNAGIPQAVATIFINQMKFNHARYTLCCFILFFWFFVVFFGGGVYVFLNLIEWQSGTILFLANPDPVSIRLFPGFFLFFQHVSSGNY